GTAPRSCGLSTASAFEVDLEVVVADVDLAGLDLRPQLRLVVVAGRDEGLDLLDEVLLAVRGLFVAHAVPDLLAGLAKGVDPHHVLPGPRRRGGVDRVLPVGDHGPRGRAGAGADRHERNAPRLQGGAVDRHLPPDGTAVGTAAAGRGQHADADQS